MSIFDYFRNDSKATASIAKERLQIIVAHERNKRHQPDFLPQMQREILAVIAKYIAVDNDMIQVKIDKSDDCSILELNVTLPEELEIA